MLLLFIPLGQWKAVEVFCEASGKPVFQSWHRWCPAQQGFTPGQLQWGDTAQLFLGQPFLGWRLGEGASLLSLLGPHVPVLVTAAVAMFNMEGGSFYQASPAGCPWSHQTCHLSHSTGLVQAKTHVLHIMPFLLHFPLGSAPTTAVSTTNLGVHHIFALKLIIAAPQTVPEGWGKAAAKPRTPLLPVPAFPGYRHWGECVWPPG